MKWSTSAVPAVSRNRCVARRRGAPSSSMVSESVRSRSFSSLHSRPLPASEGQGSGAGELVPEGAAAGGRWLCLTRAGQFRIPRGKAHPRKMRSPNVSS